MNFTRIAEWIEAVLKFGGLLAAFGYMSIRSHLNFLGISAIGPLSNEVYLMEAYHLLLVTLMPIAILVLKGGVILIAGGFAVRWWLDRKKLRNATKLAHWRPQKRTFSAVAIFLLAWLLILHSGFHKILGASDVTVGSLAPSRVPDEGAIASARVAYFLTCLAGLVCYGILAFGASEASNSADSVSKALRVLCFIGLAGLLFNIPLLFGRCGHSMQYPEVEITTKEPTRSLTGVLILQNEKSVTVWNVQNTEGQTLILSQEDIAEIKVKGLVNILERARSIAEARQKGI